MTKTDGLFLKHFSQIIAGLMLFTLVLIVYAYYVNDKFYTGTMGAERQAAKEQRALERIKPVSGVYAGATGLAAKAEADRLALEALKKNVPYGGREDGAEIYGGLCKACHDTGAGGAPKMEKALWAARVSQGEDTMIKHATEGFQGAAGIMPARGGNPALTDAQVAASVRWMVANLK